METTTTTTNTNNSQYGIREDAEFSLGAIMDVTESSHDGEVDVINQGEANTTTLNMDFSLNNRLNIFL